MKRFGVVLASIVFVSSVFATPVQLAGDCNLTAGNADCEVFNNMPWPVYCVVRGYGMTSSGANAFGKINGWVQPGQYAYLTIHANNPFVDPLVNASVNADCAY